MLQHPLVRDGYEHIYHLLLAKTFEEWLRTHHFVTWSEIQPNTWPLTRRQRRNLFEMPFRFARWHLTNNRDLSLSINELQLYFDPLPSERPNAMMNYIGRGGHEYVVLHDADDPRQRLNWDLYRLGRYLAFLERLAVRRLSIIWAQERRRKEREQALLFLDYGGIQVYRCYSRSGLRTFDPFKYTLLVDLADADYDADESEWLFDVRDLATSADDDDPFVGASIGNVTVEVGLTTPKEEHHGMIIKHAIDAGVVTRDGVIAELKGDDTVS